MGVSNAWAGRVYFKPQSAWASSDARLAAYFYGNGDSWKDLKKVGDYYVCDIPEGGYTHIIFCRMNGSQSANNWDNKWNQSAGDSNITLKNNALYTQPALNNNWDGWTCTGQVITWYVAGDFNQWNTSANKLDCSINLDANKTYAFKIYGNGIWLGNDGTMTRQYSEGWIMDNAADCHITTDLAGSYQFSFDINTGKLTVAYPEQCFLKGSFNNWEETHSILNGSVIVTLAAGTHTFKIYRYDSHGTPYWCGNTGTMTRDNCSGWTMSSEVNDDCKITADFDGNYTFTYDRSKGNLSVTYPTAYTVTYSQTPTAAADAPTSSISSGAYVLANTSVTFNAKAANTGYTWKGWYDNNVGTGNALSSNQSYTRSITTNTTIYAVYTANTYTVKFDANDGTGSMSNQNFTYGTAQNLTANIFTRTGYTFAGWATSANGNKVYNDKQSVSNLSTTNGAIVTLYAKWTATNYTVTYNTNGGNSIAQKNYTIETATFDLPTPTRTGYTFAGWYDNANLTGNKVTQVAKGSTGNKTFYAAWTINQYTLTYSAGEGGSVTGTKESGAKIDYNTSITLTATPSAGNVFVEWVNESGTMVSTANPYTFNLTANKTVKAEFAPPTTVYLKPVDFWPADNARFAIYTWGAGKTDRWVEMQHVDCENQYYSANIPSGYTNFKYIRLNPAGKGNASKNDGLHFDYRWNETGNLTVQEDLLYTTPRIYLKPNSNWTQTNARFAAYFFEDGKEAQWMSMYKDGNYYYCDMVDGYSKVIFCRMNPATETNDFANCWNKSADQTIAGNCFTITAGQWGDNPNDENYTEAGAAGTWSEYYTTFTTPTYPLTLKATPYGEYTVKCNGVSHTSSRTKDIVIDLPVGATVEITKAESYDAAYNNDLVIKTSSNSQYEAAELNTTYTFCGATTIEENFTTTAAHVVYLRVATSGDANAWNTSGANYIYCTNRLTNKVVAMEAVAAGNSEINQETGYNYSKATIPAGYRAFRFERKTALNAGATNTTEYFEHLLPLGQSNCFTIEGKNTLLETFYGDWALGTAEGDYRILYVEQQVAHGTGADDWKTVIDTTYQHSSDIIKKGDGATIVSLHIKYDKTKHPEVILQKFTNGEWVDVEGQAHMVLSPLTASADMAMLPGRRNVEGDVNLQYGDGIEKIKDDAANGKEGRVWNFVVQQSDASAYINFNTNDFAPYEGDYYIRTDNAAGGWMTYAIPGNVMSYSTYSLEHSGYSHYFCKWVALDGTPNVKFVVANDYGAAISDTIASDIYTDNNGTLEANANVRWMWNEYTNMGSRAYIAGSSGSSASNFLVAKYAASSTKTFADKGEWVYEVDLTVKIDDKLTSIAATYDDQVQELLEKSHVDAGGLVMLSSAGNDARVSSYTVRIVYDFKINQTICYLIPTGTAVATSIDVIIERINQDEAGQATQVTAAITPANKEVGLTVYGLITLTKDHITNSAKSEQEALTYWISFPFDVKIGDITGFGEVGKHWMIKYYDGAERAEKGWFLDTKTFWKFFTNTEDVMNANTGYVLTLNKNLLNESNSVYDNTDVLKLYFPSKEKITTEINGDLTTTTVDVPEHWCKIERPRDRTTADSHWNLIGVPSYANQNITTDTKSVKYFYNYSHKDDTYNVAVNGGAKTFHPMHAYMVQFGGTIDWKNSTFTEGERPQLAAKKNADAEEQYTLRLELQQNGKKVDQTFVELQDDATAMFDMNVDLTKMFNASANIYTLIDSDNQVAANVMPVENTVIPVGVQVATAGEYTFAMPDGTDGVVVELIDYEANITTNLFLSDYTVNLPAGANETRFALSVKPNKTATSVDNISGATGDEAKKYIIDGVLYLQRDGALYDAQGHIVR